jgi:hypothetical protein
VNEPIYLGLIMQTRTGAGDVACRQRRSTVVISSYLLPSVRKRRVSYLPSILQTSTGAGDVAYWKKRSSVFIAFTSFLLHSCEQKVEHSLPLHLADEDRRG